jgi:hypothetical protein
LNDRITPSLQLETLVILDDVHRSTTTREPAARRAPSFMLVRGAHSCAWAVNADVVEPVARELDALAREEPATSDWNAPLRHVDRYIALLDGERTDFGPSFAFPERVDEPDMATSIIEDEQVLAVHFKGWMPGEIAGGCAPVHAILVDGVPVSICFCARRSETAAEAGVETAAPFRGRGLALRVTAAWARAIRAERRIPLYSTSWTNRSSLAVARKLGLLTYATVWSSSPR